MSGLNMFQMIRMKFVGWTTYSAFRFFLYLEHYQEEKIYSQTDDEWINLTDIEN